VAACWLSATWTCPQPCEQQQQQQQQYWQQQQQQQQFLNDPDFVSRYGRASSSNAAADSFNSMSDVLEASNWPASSPAAAQQQQQQQQRQLGIL
jgi:hypothetical protein